MHYKHFMLTDAIKHSKGGQIDFENYIKKLNILDAIHFVDKAWQAVPKSAMFGVWNKLLAREQPHPSKDTLLEKEKLNESFRQAFPAQTMFAKDKH